MLAPERKVYIYGFLRAAGINENHFGLRIGRPTANVAEKL